MSNIEKKGRVKYFTAEHCSPGHPDKVMDSVAEALVDAYVDIDPMAHVAVDGVVKGKMLLCGEISSSAIIDRRFIAQKVLNDIGYIPRDTEMAAGEISAEFNSRDLILEEQFTEQSPDIAMGVNRSDDILDEGAGDQGMAISGAIAESQNFITHAQELARNLNIKLFVAANDGTLPWARPDIKTQVTIKYVDGVPSSIDSIVVSISHIDSIPLECLRSSVKAFAETIVLNYCEENNLHYYPSTKWFINATGKFSVYGPQGDSGEVGRKIVCDQLGGRFAVGGGNLNGKDASKVDRIGVYMARYAAKNVVVAGLASECEINVAYCIGVKDPVSVTVNTFDTCTVDEQILEEAVKAIFDFTPGGIIKKFNLLAPSSERGWTYKQLGMYGHTGYPDLPWEQVDMADTLKAKVEELTASK